MDYYCLILYQEKPHFLLKMILLFTLSYFIHDYYSLILSQNFHFSLKKSFF